MSLHDLLIPVPGQLENVTSPYAMTLVADTVSCKHGLSASPTCKDTGSVNGRCYAGGDTGRGQEL